MLSDMGFFEWIIGLLLFRTETYAAIARNPAYTPVAVALVLLLSSVVGLLSGLFFPSPVLGGLLLAPGIVHGGLLAGVRLLGWGSGWLAGALAGALFVSLPRSRPIPFAVLLRLFGITFIFGLFWLVPALGILLVPIGGFIALIVGLCAIHAAELWPASALAALMWAVALATSSFVQTLLLDLGLPLLIARFGIPNI